MSIGRRQGKDRAVRKEALSSDTSEEDTQDEYLPNTQFEVRVEPKVMSTWRVRRLQWRLLGYMLCLQRETFRFFTDMIVTQTLPLGTRSRMANRKFHPSHGCTSAISPNLWPQAKELLIGVKCTGDSS